MNEDLFINKIKEFSDQMTRRINAVEKELQEMKAWIETLIFFVEKRLEIKERYE